MWTLSIYIKHVYKAFPTFDFREKWALKIRFLMLIFIFEYIMTNWNKVPDNTISQKQTNNQTHKNFNFVFVFNKLVKHFWSVAQPIKNPAVNERRN